MRTRRAPRDIFAPRERGATLWIGLFVVLGVLLRFTGLGVQSMWYDECCTVCIAGAEHTLELLKSDRHPPLHFLAFDVWMKQFGENDEIMRVLPALISCASIVLFATLAGRILSARATTLAVALYAVSPFAIWIGQEVRMYAFVEFGTLLALLGVQTFISGRRGKGWWWMAIGTAIALGSHYYGSFVGVSIGFIALASVAFGRIGLVEAAAIATAPFVALLAWLPWLITAIPLQMKTDWGFQARMGASDVLELPVRFVLVGLTAIPEGWRWMGYVIGAPLIVGFALALLRAVAKLRLENLWILIAFAAPIATALVLGLFAPLSFSPRYLVTAEPAAVLLIAVGLDSIEIAPLRMLLVGIGWIGALGLSCLHKTGNVREDYRAACAEVAAQWKPGDSVISISGTGEVFSQGPLRHYLRDKKDIIDSIQDSTLVTAAVKESFAPHQRVHVVYREATYAQGGLDALKKTMHVVQEDPKRFRIQHIVLEMP